MARTYDDEVQELFTRIEAASVAVEPEQKSHHLYMITVQYERVRELVPKQEEACPPPPPPQDS